MGEVYFYHLTRAPLEVTLPTLLEKAVGAGMKCVVRGTEATDLEALDLAIWTARDDSFLPHGVAGGDHDAAQPILLTKGAQASYPNNANCLMSVHGAEVTADEATALTRACILFDGNDGAALQHAREQWRSLTGAGVTAQYWSEESGRWEKKAEHKPD